MKNGIHPKTYNDCAVTCACGNSFVTSSTLPSMKIDICSACHPFFTGQHKFVDTEGRIDKFNRKLKLIESKKPSGKPAKTEKVKTAPAARKSVKEILETLKKEADEASQS